MITVVIRPFKSGGQFYPAGSIIDPAGFKLYKSRLGSGNLAVVGEHNLEAISRYLHVRQRVENCHEVLSKALEDAKNKPEEPTEVTSTEDKEPQTPGTSKEDTKEEDPVDPEYFAKVSALAEQLDVDMEDRPLAEVVAEIKEKAEKAKKSKKEK